VPPKAEFEGVVRPSHLQSQGKKGSSPSICWERAHPKGECERRHSRAVEEEPLQVFDASSCTIRSRALTTHRIDLLQGTATRATTS